MNCPVCDDVKMREVHKNDILIDVCPSCKGVWLDRGELDKLMVEVKEVRQEFNQWSEERDNRSYRPDKDDRDYKSQNQQYGQSHGQYPKKKKKGVMDMFGDLFD